MSALVSQFKKDAAMTIRGALSGWSRAFRPDGGETQAFDSQIQAALDSVDGAMLYPPDFSLGHVGYPCHALSKLFRKPPMAIATGLAEWIQSHEILAQVPGRSLASVRAVAGYVNFEVDLNQWAKAILAGARHKPVSELVKGGGLFPPHSILPEAIRERMLVEYSQPNTHKALHVGHLRNMVYGDAVCRILDFAGHSVVRATFPGDMGAHIAKCLYFIDREKRGELDGVRGASKNSDRADWLGVMYAQSDDWVKAREASEGESSTVKREVAQALVDLEEERGDLLALYRETREWSLAQMREVYDWLGLHFDVWYYESECDKPSREFVKKKFEEGFFVRDQGAIGIDLSAYGLGFALYLRREGSGLYLTKDLELLRRKFEDYQVDRSIVVVDARQKLHFQQLFKTAELMGFPQAAKSVHLAYESVTDENGVPCSSRSLTGIKLSQLRKLLEDKVVATYLEGYRGQWSDEEISKTAEQVALGALKYGFLKVDANRVIRFVLDEWVQLEGDTGPYLQYTYARCQSILEKQGRADAQIPMEYENATERELALFLERFADAVATSSQEFRPSVLCSYLFDLAKLLNRFYKESPIKTAPNASVKNLRLMLVEGGSHVLQVGLGILGIPCPQRL